MCINITPNPRMFSSSIANKRKVSIDTVMPQTEKKPLSFRQYKRPRLSSSSTKKKSVQFHPEVKLRCVTPSNNDPQDTTWINPLELCEMKASARNLAKAHLIRSIVHSREEATTSTTPASSPPPVSPALHPARYEIEGESLRGMEIITDLSAGKSRRLSRDAAIKSVDQEQCRQVLVHALKCCNGDVSLLNAVECDVLRGFVIDRTELSRVYGEKTKDALAYSRRLAEEDARMAAEILSQDL